jgi:glucokinase
VKRKAILGIDIGGTKVRLAPVFKDAGLGESTEIQVPQGVKPRELAALIAQHAAELKNITLLSAGAGCPGHVANDRRTLVYAPNLKWRKVDFAQLLEDGLHVPVVLENDVNAAALGEHRYGAGKGADNVICVFVGTGVGGGIISGGRLLRGATGNAAEVGHTLFRPGGRTCSCGRAGCVEAYAGGAHIPAYYKELGGEPGLTASRIWQRAGEADPFALVVKADAVQALTALLVNLQTVFDAERIVLGGGVIRHVKDLCQDVKREMAGCLKGMWKSNVAIVRSQLWGDAGILGAASLAADLLHNR